MLHRHELSKQKPLNSGKNQQKVLLPTSTNKEQSPSHHPTTFKNQIIRPISLLTVGGGILPGCIPPIGQTVRLLLRGDGRPWRVVVEAALAALLLPLIAHVLVTGCGTGSGPPLLSSYRCCCLWGVHGGGGPTYASWRLLIWNKTERVSSGDKMAAGPPINTRTTEQRGARRLFAVINRPSPRPANNEL